MIRCWDVPVCGDISLSCGTGMQRKKHWLPSVLFNLVWIRQIANIDQAILAVSFSLSHCLALINQKYSV